MDWGSTGESSGPLFPRGSWQVRDLWSIWSSTAGKQQHDRLGGCGVLYKVGRTCFLGWGELAKAEMEDCVWCVLGFLDNEAFPLRAGWLRFRSVGQAAGVASVVRVLVYELPFSGSQNQMTSFTCFILSVYFPTFESSSGRITVFLSQVH